MKMNSRLILLVLGLTILASSTVFPAYAQTEPPSDPNAPWNPPPPPSQGAVQTARKPMIVPPNPGPGPGPGTVIGYMTDYQYNKKDTFSGSETMYLVLMTSSVAYAVLWWEYYPAGTVPGGHWVIGPAWAGPYSGTIAFGPTSPEPSEPYGLHVERLKVYDFRSGTFAEGLVRWTYQSPPVQTVPISVSVSVSSTSPSPGQLITVTGSVSPVPTGGTLAIQVTSPGGAWVQLQSFNVASSSGSFSTSWSVPSSGTYGFQAVYSGYLDSAANQQYPQTFSTTTSLTVSTTVVTTPVSPVTPVTTIVTTTTTPPWWEQIPGFPVESIFSGLLIGLLAVVLLRRTQRKKTSHMERQ